MAHTPGPWQIEWEWCECDWPCNHGKYPYRIIAPESRVQKTWNKQPLPAYVANIAEAEDATHEDAYLIAAAPDLLAACEIALQLAEIVSDWNLDEVEINGEMEHIDNVRYMFATVIAKAKGDPHD